MTSPSIPRVRATMPAAFLVLAALPFARLRSQETPYYPGPHPTWERRQPAQVGMSASLLEAAIAFARESESPGTRDLEEAHYLTFGREPHGEGIGPFKVRGDPAGVIVRRGYVVAEWGDPDRVDMTFSVTKSFLSTVVGLAFDRGLIPDLSAPVQPFVTTGEFDSEHNRTIAWEHLLRQTSDWEGTLWNKPDWADRPPTDRPLAEYVARKHHPPGTSYKYNDVRVNVLAYAALMVWRRPLPQVLREYVMDPIGASNTWRWYGYENSWVNLDGVMVQSVSGGGHWGGGLFISAHDQARFGLLTLRRGKWRDRQVLSDRWVTLARTPTPVQADYGFMNWFLNTGRRRWPSAPESTFCHLGSGTNLICALPEYDLVVVARWIRANAVDGMLQRVVAAIQDGPRPAEGR